MEMNNKLKLITYNCKHFVCGGHKFDFLNSLFCMTYFLFMSEHWLYESEFYKLSSLGRSAGVVAYECYGSTQTTCWQTVWWHSYPSYSPTSHKSTQLPTIQQRSPF